MDSLAGWPTLFRGARGVARCNAKESYCQADRNTDDET